MENNQINYDYNGYGYDYNNDYEDENFYDQDFDEMPHITVALTGASGFPYGLRLIECLLTMSCRVSVVYSNAAVSVAMQECGLELPILNNNNDTEIAKKVLLMCFQNGVNADLLDVYAENDFFSPIASGSSCADAMIICPCSMGNLAKIAHGISDSLIARAADVIIKERKPLVLVPREMPFSTLHLQNMLELSKVGAVIMPPCPGFYLYPQNIGDMIDFVVCRILEQLNLSPKNVSSWSKVLLNNNANDNANNNNNGESNNFVEIAEKQEQNQQMFIDKAYKELKELKESKKKYAKAEKISKAKTKTKTKNKRKSSEVSEEISAKESIKENEISEINEINAENINENENNNIVEENAEVSEVSEVEIKTEAISESESEAEAENKNDEEISNPNDIEQTENPEDEKYDFW